jgi:DNA-binding GntR family transcriptional regulator
MKGSEPLAEKAYQQIKRMLLLDEMVAGQKIRYQDLTNKLKVSQTPVILALTRLENEGLVTSEANRGFFVPELDLDEARELYEIRTELEGFLAASAAGRITDEQLAQLRALMDEHRSIRGEVYRRERLWADAKLHLALAAASGHGVGRQFLHQIFDRLYLRYKPERLTPERMQEAEVEHERLFKALQAHDPVASSDLVRKHIERGTYHMLNGLRKEFEMRDSFSMELTA